MIKWRSIVNNRLSSSAVKPRGPCRDPIAGEIEFGERTVFCDSSFRSEPISSVDVNWTVVFVTKTSSVDSVRGELRLLRREIIKLIGRIESRLEHGINLHEFYCRSDFSLYV